MADTSEAGKNNGTSRMVRPGSANAAPLDAPKQAPYKRHLFLCAGRYCDPEGKAVGLYNRLPRLLGELGAYDNPERVKRGLTPCLGVCYGGPLMVVYPDGVWYHHVDDALLERIVREHLVDGRPVEDAIFHSLVDDDTPDAGMASS